MDNNEWWNSSTTRELFERFDAEAPDRIRWIRETWGDRTKEERDELSAWNGQVERRRGDVIAARLGFKPLRPGDVLTFRAGRDDDSRFQCFVARDGWDGGAVTVYPCGDFDDEQALVIQQLPWHVVYEYSGYHSDGFDWIDALPTREWYLVLCRSRLCFAGRSHGIPQGVEVPAWLR